MNTFADIGVDTNVLKALSDLGFTAPTPIQEKVIPLMLDRKADMVSLAQTGTGKTAAFGVPLVQLSDPKNRKTQSLVLCPTRELCMQVTRDLKAYAMHIHGVKVLAIYGGSPIDQQIRILRQGVQMIVATPGRLNDLIRRGRVDISAVNYVVLDEADEMLNMGFQEDLKTILAQTPAEKNTLLFSATMSREISRISKKYMSDPIEVTVGKRNAGAENVTHELYLVKGGDRYPALKRIVDNSPDIYAIIFCRTRKETHDVANRLMQDGYNADALHGDLTQAQRDQVMGKFRAKTLQILVATDVAARGLDINDLTHVVNYNLPDDTSGYTHRSGRTGRAGRSGISVVIVQPRERYRISRIEKNINKKFKQCRIPTGEEICKRQLSTLIEVVSNVAVDHDQIDPLYPEVAKKLADLDRVELIKRFISVEFNKLLEYYKYAPDLNVKDTTQKQRSKKSPPRRTERTTVSGDGKHKFTRFFLNVGRRQGIAPKDLMAKINSIHVAGRIDIGKIELKRNSAVLEGDSRFVSEILDVFQNSKINGKIVSIEVVQANQRTNRPKRGGKKGRGKGRD